MEMRENKKRKLAQSIAVIVLMLALAFCAVLGLCYLYSMAESGASSQFNSIVSASCSVGVFASSASVFSLSAASLLTLQEYIEILLYCLIVVFVVLAIIYTIRMVLYLKAKKKQDEIIAQSIEAMKEHGTVIDDDADDQDVVFADTVQENSIDSYGMENPELWETPDSDKTDEELEQEIMEILLQGEPIVQEEVVQEEIVQEVVQEVVQEPQVVASEPASVFWQAIEPLETPEPAPAPIQVVAPAPVQVAAPMVAQPVQYFNNVVARPAVDSTTINHERHYNYLIPLLSEVYWTNEIIDTLQTFLSEDTVEKTTLRNEVGEIQNSILNVSDVAIISKLKEVLENKNKQVVNIDMSIAENISEKVAKLVDLESYANDACDYAVAEQMTLNYFVGIEDKAILDILAQMRIDKAAVEVAESEEAVGEQQILVDSLHANSGIKLENVENDITEQIYLADEEVEYAVDALEKLNDKVNKASAAEIETLLDEQQKAIKMLKELRAMAQEARSDGLKIRYDYKKSYDDDVNEQVEKLGELKEKHLEAVKHHEYLMSIGFYDGLEFVSGSGYVSQLLKERLLKNGSFGANGMNAEGATNAQSSSYTNALIDQMRQDEQAALQKMVDDLKDHNLSEQEQIKKLLVNTKVQKRIYEIIEQRKKINNLETEKEGLDLNERFYQILVQLDEEEKSSVDLVELINRSMRDTSHAIEILRYKALGQKQRRPRRKHRRSSSVSSKRERLSSVGGNSRRRARHASERSESGRERMAQLRAARKRRRAAREKKDA